MKQKTGNILLIGLLLFVVGCTEKKKVMDRDVLILIFSDASKKYFDIGASFGSYSTSSFDEKGEDINIKILSKENIVLFEKKVGFVKERSQHMCVWKDKSDKKNKENCVRAEYKIELNVEYNEDLENAYKLEVFQKDKKIDEQIITEDK